MTHVGFRPKEHIMNRDDFVKLVGVASDEEQYVPVVYPVAHIGSLMRRAEGQKSRPYRFLDLNQSEIIRLLQTKLW
jgi:hypothetical protein